LPTGKKTWLPHNWEDLKLFLSDGTVTTDGPYVGLSAEEAIERLGEDGWDSISWLRESYGSLYPHPAYITASRSTPRQ
jgi:hypothetical protein